MNTAVLAPASGGAKCDDTLFVVAFCDDVVGLRRARERSGASH